MEKAFPIIQTDRLLLRKLREEDARPLFELRSDARVNAFIRRDPPGHINVIQTFIRDRNTDFENNKLIYWAICKKDDPELIGTCCLWNFNSDENTAEVGYELHPECQGKGLMSEAVNAILDYGFKELNFNMIEAIIHENNAASKNLARKFGFVLNPERKDKEVVENLIFERYA